MNYRQLLISLLITVLKTILQAVYNFSRFWAIIFSTSFQ